MHLTLIETFSLLFIRIFRRCLGSCRRVLHLFYFEWLSLTSGMVGGARPPVGGDAGGHGADRAQKQQARRAVEKLSGSDSFEKVW